MLVCRLWGVAMTLPTTAAACLAALAATAHDSAVVTAVAVLSPSLTIQPPGLGARASAQCQSGAGHQEQPLSWASGEPVHQEGPASALWDTVPATSHVGSNRNTLHFLQDFGNKAG